MAKKAAYRLDTERKIITIDDTVNATAAEEKDIDRYVNAGYIIKHKSQTRSKQAASRADGLKNDIILEILKDKPEALKEYEDIKTGKSPKGKGFFKAKSWFKDNFSNEYEAYLKKKK